MDMVIRLYGQIDGWPTKDRLASLLASAGFSVAIGRYSIRLNDCEHFVFQEYGGDLGEPRIDADASSLEKMLADAGRVSCALASADIRHRFELCDIREELVGYLHHQWPKET